MHRPANDLVALSSSPRDGVASRPIRTTASRLSHEALTRLLIVEDHAGMRDILVEAVRRLHGFSVCASVSSGESAVACLDSVEPDLALVDLSLPAMTGVDLVALLHERIPALRCLILSGHREPHYVQQAISAGARGYVLEGAPAEIERAVRHVAGGNVYLGAGRALK